MKYLKIPLSAELRNRILYGVMYGLIFILAVLSPGVIFWAILALFFGICGYEMVRMLPNQNLNKTLFSLAILGISFLSLGFLRLSFGAYTLVGFLIATFAFDTFCYFGGRYFRGVKLIPAISPNKTVSGLVCGLVGLAVLSPWLLAWNSWFLGLFLSVGLGLAFLGGDLLISQLKRRAGVKDTGALIPGHGGLLDRMDSLLLAVPLYWVSLLAFGTTS